ncbi:MAG: YhdH/YhfP family quinone oxidoreductase [Spirochaetia bacterium]|jgi:putative YhdH/YhfP family quinone oxidoreductase
MSEFDALVVSQEPDGTFTREIVRKDTADLPAGDLLVRVAYSSLNFKDALAASGRRGVARGYPLTPGIDAAGTVAESSVAEWSSGERVIIGGHELGTGIPGGFGGYIRVPAAAALRLPAGLTRRQSMVIGTAGFTAAFSIRTLRENGITPGSGEVLVTGATGGVGCMAVALLSKLGYTVFAGTGKEHKHDFLLSLGARGVIPRAELDDSSGKALLRERWAAVVDSVGGGILSTAIRSTAYGGSVAVCGNAASPDLPMTVFPFILRGVRLLGIESARCPAPVRQELWEKLAGPWKPSQLDSLAEECSLKEVGGKVDAILRGEVTGRIVVNLGGV